MTVHDAIVAWDSVFHVPRTKHAGELTLTRELDDDECAVVEATLGATTVELGGRESARIDSGDTRLEIDVSEMRHPYQDGDDCGGTATYYDVIVARLP